MASMKNKPAENTTVSLGAIVTALLAVLHAYGVNVPPEVYGLVTLLVAATPHAVTWFVNWRQRRDATGIVAKDVGQEHG